MSPIDPTILTRFVEVLTKKYHAVPTESDSTIARAWTNPWNKGDGPSKIFVTRSNLVRFGEVITKANFMSERSIISIIEGRHPVVQNSSTITTTHLTPDAEVCLSPLAPKPIEPTGETIMARTPAVKKEAAPKTPKTPKTAAPAKTAAPKKAAAAAKEPKTPRENTSGVKIDRTKYQYETSEIKSASGRKTVSNGDPLALALAGKSADQVVEILSTVDATKVKDWSHLNEGMRRMSAGNILRSLWKKAGVLTIDGKRVKVPAAA